MQYRRIKGMSDIFFPENKKWQFIENKAHLFFGARLYEEIRTPVLEYTNLFTRSIGESSDIVSKEMYSFEDRGARSLTMRPEMTASVMRAAIENNLLAIREPLKLFYIGQMFRAERPQAGRKRQFFQLGVEVLGDESPFMDAQVIRDLAFFLINLGFKENEFNINLNNVGCQNCRPAFIETLKAFFEAKLENLCKDCNFRFDKNVLRVFDCKNPECKEIVSHAPKVGENVCNDCQCHFQEVLEDLERFKINYEVDKNMVRGLDYYTGTVFEVTSNKLGAQDAIGAGGRYNNLMKELGGKDKGAIGFALGMERLLMCLEDVFADYASNVLDKTVYVAYSDKNYIAQAKSIISNLENYQIATYSDLDERSLKGQLKRANKFGFRWVVILNQDETEDGKCTLKDMRSDDKEQFVVEIDNVDVEIKRILCGS